jgi:hypothetical protein
LSTLDNATGGLRMKTALTVLLMMSVLSVTSASAVAVGHRACADAAVVGDITHQTYETIRSNDPKALIFDVVLHVDVAVHAVRYGSVSTGPLRISGVAHTVLNDKTVHVFYLKRGPDKSWRIADCDRP